MAKTGFWLNGSNGKLAGATMYKDSASGETIIREVNKHPRNPKTDKQTIQRIIMNTVINAYSLMKKICDHSFEGQQAGRITMGYFVKQNVQIAREAIARMQNQGVDFYQMFNFNLLGERKFVANQYQVSMGSLPQIPVQYDQDLGLFIPGITNPNATYQDICDALGLVRGDQLTFLLVGKGANQSVDQFAFARVILDPTDPETHLPVPMDTPFLVGSNVSVNCPSVRNEGVVKFVIDAELGGMLYLNGGALRQSAGAVIASRQSGEDWLRSTAYLVYAENNDHSLGEAMDAAINGANTIYASNARYLNNAGQGGGVAAATGEESGAGEGGGSSTPSTANVTAFTVAGQSVTSGTVKVLGANHPASAACVATLSEAATGTAKIVKVADNSTIASQAINGSSVTVTATELADDVVYKLVVNFGDGDVQTGYQFKWSGDEEIPGD